jgi:hypothetical protein
MRSRALSLAVFAALWLSALAPLAAAPLIPRGVDTFTTPANGSTFYDFKANPIPAGFFCKRSAPFTGRVVLRGVPLATEVPGQLHNADTVIERLDDATFDENGVATTRLRFKALSLASLAPIRTACGAYHVYVKLADRQRETTMKIHRTSEEGGSFVAPLAVDAQMTFVPVRAAKGAAGRTLQLVGSFTFPAQPLPWSHEAGPQVKRVGLARIDTDGDQTPDSLVSETLNFAPGWGTALPLKGPGQIIPPPPSCGCPTCSVCEPPICHTDPSTGKQHCTGGTYVCAGNYCP